MSFVQVDAANVALNIVGATSGATATAEGTTTADQLVSVDTVLTSDSTFEDGETLNITESGQTGAATATASI